MKSRLTRSKFPHINIYLGLTEVFGRFRVYGLLCFVFAVCTFLMIVPLNLQSTMYAPSFISYMGAGQSDIRIDIQQSEDITAQFEAVTAAVEADADIAKYAAFATCAFSVQNPQGEYETIRVESGDFSVFPLLYAAGRAPERVGEIALSQMNAGALDRQPGDTLILQVQGEMQEMLVCGIYQDVTNGGKTAKAYLSYDAAEVLRFVVNIDVVPGTDIAQKAAEYTQRFYPAKVTEMDSYVSQTLGSVLERLQTAVVLSIMLALLMAALITAMFFKMQIAKDRAQIAILRSIGFSVWHIRIQYFVRAAAVLVAGVALGILAAGTAGEWIAALLLSGVSQLTFVVNPVISYLICPLALAIAAAVMVLISSVAINKNNIIHMMGE